MYRDALQKLEGVWIGTERFLSNDVKLEASARWAFHTVFDGLFLLCDYVQTAPDRSTSVGHGVFRKDEKTQALTVTWFRSPAAATYQQVDGVAEGDRLTFYEKQGETNMRTQYALHLNTLAITTERSVKDGEWEQIFEGSYKRPRG
jgi:Protein of unknown function (DUF1579)